VNQVYMIYKMDFQYNQQLYKKHKHCRSDNNKSSFGRRTRFPSYLYTAWGFPAHYYPDEQKAGVWTSLVYAILGQEGPWF